MGPFHSNLSASPLPPRFPLTSASQARRKGPLCFEGALMLLSTFMWLFNISRACECRRFSWGRLRTPFPTENTHRTTDVRADAAFQCTATHIQHRDTLVVDLRLPWPKESDANKTCTRRVDVSAVLTFHSIYDHFSSLFDLIHTLVFANFQDLYKQNRSIVNSSSNKHEWKTQHGKW